MLDIIGELGAPCGNSLILVQSFASSVATSFEKLNGGFKNIPLTRPKFIEGKKFSR
jgi:hypothetical protein